MDNVWERFREMSSHLDGIIGVNNNVSSKRPSGPSSTAQSKRFHFSFWKFPTEHVIPTGIDDWTSLPPKYRHVRKHFSNFEVNHCQKTLSLASRQRDVSDVVGWCRSSPRVSDSVTFPLMTVFLHPNIPIASFMHHESWAENIQHLQLKAETTNHTNNSDSSFLQSLQSLQSTFN